MAQGGTTDWVWLAEQILKEMPRSQFFDARPYHPPSPIEKAAGWRRDVFYPPSIEYRRDDGSIAYGQLIEEPSK